MTTQSVYNIGVRAGIDCARFCWEECAELHKGEPIWPGDNELVAEFLGCNKSTISAKLEYDRKAEAELWRGFSKGVEMFNSGLQKLQGEKAKAEVRRIKTTAEDFFCGVSEEAGLKYLRENCMGKDVNETTEKLKFQAKIDNNATLHGVTYKYQITGFRALAKKLHEESGR